MRGIRVNNTAKILGVLPILALLATGCFVKEETGEPEKCEQAPRISRWNFDCTAACANLTSCKSQYEDADLKEMTCSSCMEACLEGISLGGNDILQEPGEDSASWACTEKIKSCYTLDKTCDLF